MSMSWTIGTFFKIPIRLHISMLLVPLLTYNWMPIQGIIDIVAWAALVVLLFGSVLLHEIGHALTARRYGIRTQDIILTPIGGMARIVSMPQKPIQEIAIAVAGPVVSLAIAGIGFALSIFFGLVPQLPLAVFKGVGLLFWINVMLGVFNLVPALPMDGGRILRGFLAMKHDYLKATQIAAKVGRALAVAGAILAIFWLKSWSLALISMFIYISAGTEVRMAQMRAYQQRMTDSAKAAYGPNGQPQAWPWPSNSRSPRPSHPPEDQDWSKPHRPANREVVVIQGGKAEIVSRTDPDED